MLCSSVGELIYWMYETTDDYDMATSMSKYLMFQGELAFVQDRCEPGIAPDEPSKRTQLVKETKRPWLGLPIGRESVNTMDIIHKNKIQEDGQSDESRRMDQILHP